MFTALSTATATSANDNDDDVMNWTLHNISIMAVGVARKQINRPICGKFSKVEMQNLGPNPPPTFWGTFWPRLKFWALKILCVCSSATFCRNSVVNLQLPASLTLIHDGTTPGREKQLHPPPAKFQPVGKFSEKLHLILSSTVIPCLHLYLGWHLTCSTHYCRVPNKGHLFWCYIINTVSHAITG